jgi:hypothetical protein
MSNKEIIERDITRRKEAIHDREAEINRQIDVIVRTLKPRESKEAELSRPSYYFSGSITDYVRWLQQHKDSQFELSQNTEERDVELKRKIDKCVEAILQTYGKDF